MKTSLRHRLLLLLSFLSLTTTGLAALAGTPETPGQKSHSWVWEEKKIRVTGLPNGEDIFIIPAIWPWVLIPSAGTQNGERATGPLTLKNQEGETATLELLQIEAGEGSARMEMRLTASPKPVRIKIEAARPREIDFPSLTDIHWDTRNGSRWSDQTTGEATIQTEGTTITTTSGTNLPMNLLIQTKEPGKEKAEIKVILNENQSAEVSVRAN